MRVGHSCLQRRSNVQACLNFPFEPELQLGNGIACQCSLGRTHFAVCLGRHVVEHYERTCWVTSREADQFLSTDALAQLLNDAS